MEKGNNNSCCGLGEGERGSEQRGAGAREQLLEAGWESCWGLGTGMMDPAQAGRGGERVWSQSHRGIKAAAEDEARPGKEQEAKGGAAKEKASRLRTRAEGRVLGGEGTHRSLGAEAPQGRARQLLRPKDRHGNQNRALGTRANSCTRGDGMAKLQTGFGG